MKIILRILAILIVAAIVAGAIYLVAGNSVSTSGSDMEGRQPPTMTNTNGQTFQPMERPEGGEDGASLSRGLIGVIGTLAKLSIIAAFVLLLRKGFDLVNNRELNTQEGTL